MSAKHTSNERVSRANHNNALKTHKSPRKKIAMKRASKYQRPITKKQYIDPVAINSADVIVHLAGESVAGKRWSVKRKKELVDSRVQ